MLIEPLWISLKTALCATVLAALAGIALARWRVGRSNRRIAALDALLLLPLALPPTVLGLMLLLVFGRRSPVGRWLTDIGIPVVFAWPGAVLAAFVVAFPIAYLTARG